MNPNPLKWLPHKSAGALLAVISLNGCVSSGGSTDSASFRLETPFGGVAVSAASRGKNQSAKRGPHSPEFKENSEDHEAGLRED